MNLQNNETIVKILYQTPNTLFVYWDIADSDRENYIKQYGENFFYITNVKNTGGAWGMFSGNVPILALISAIVVLVLIYFLKEERKLNKISITYYGILFAGIIGNLIDRLFLGYVTDFFNFYIFMITLHKEC